MRPYRSLSVLLLVACGGSTPAKPAEPASPAPPDAAIEVVEVHDAPPDAGIDPELAAAPAFVFRFVSPDRVETWTLRHVAARGVVEVVREQPARTQSLYLGTANDAGKALALELAAGKDTLSLACKREKMEVAAANATGCAKGKWVQPRTKKHDVLACKHPDFEAPMPFAAAPGVEYVVVAERACNGAAYRLVAP